MASPPDPELDDLRREVDRLDDAMIELLAERMRVVGAIARIKRPASTGLPAIRPGREASILRRLVERAGNRLPAGTLVRMWRELLAATTRAQAPLAIAAWVPPDQPELWDVARDHFGSLTSIQRAASWSHALRLVADGSTQLAVLPLPTEHEPWWPGLLDTSIRPLRIVARLPFCPSVVYPEGCGGYVVGAIEPEPSGADASLVAIETPVEVGRARLLDLLAAAGLVPLWLATRRHAETGRALHLFELEGFLLPHDQRLAQAADVGRAHVLRGVWLGGYARPLVGGT
jgi:chorismate mutase/prephenate dehydratase